MYRLQPLGKRDTYSLSFYGIVGLTGTCIGEIRKELQPSWTMTC